MVKKVSLGLMVVFAALLLGGCGQCYMKEMEPRTGDLIVGIILSQPLNYFYGDLATVEIWGPGAPHGLYQEVQLGMGNQVVIFPNLPTGKYTVTVRYNGLVATKCAIICGLEKIGEKAECTRQLKSILNRKKEEYYSAETYQWKPWAEDDELPDFYPTGASLCGHKSPCNTAVVFHIPEDALKYDP